MGKVKHFGIDKVRNIIENEGFELLSNEYENNTTELTVKCNHGHIFKTNYQYFRRNIHKCPECYKIKKRSEEAYSYEFVKSYIESFGYKLLSKEYKNTKTYLTIKCNKGHQFKMRFENFKNQNQRCSKCYGNSQHDGRYIYEEFVKLGYIPQFNPSDYENNKQLLPYICSKHPNEGVQYTTWNRISVGQGCYYCGYEVVSEKLSGENSYNWKGGVTEIKDTLRREFLFEWKTKSFEQTDYRCSLTNEKGSDLEVHHLKAFNLILNDVLQDLRLPIHNKIGNYNKEELENIKNLLKVKHFELLGVPLKRELHILFHKEYGYGNNTPEQFEEFKQRYNNGEFKDIGGE